jgi:hypothetical protein
VLPFRKDSICLPFPIVERKAWGLKSLLVFVVAICFLLRNCRGKMDATSFIVAEEWVRTLVNIAH